MVATTGAARNEHAGPGGLDWGLSSFGTNVISLVSIGTITYRCKLIPTLFTSNTLYRTAISVFSAKLGICELCASNFYINHACD